MKTLKTIRHIIFILTAGHLLSNCTVDTSGTSTGLADETPILLSSVTVGSEAVTRTGAADTYNTTLPEASSIGVYIYDNTNTYLTGRVNNTDGTIATWVYRTGAPYAIGGGLYRSALSLTSHDRTPAFPATNNVYKENVRVFAVYPNNTSYTPPASSTTATSYNVEVPLDQTGSSEANQNAIKAVDLLTTDGMITFTKTQCIDNKEIVNLQLKHQMAKLTVTFTPATGSDLTAANMPTKFDVIGVYRSLTVTPSTGTVTTVQSGSTTESAPMKGSITQSILIPPQSLTAGSTLLKFNVLGSGQFKGITGATFNVPTGGVNLQAGHEYLVNVTVDVDFVTLTETITGWAIEDIDDSYFEDNDNDGSGTSIVL